ncbi:MAG: hypothetical protein AAB215_00645 [Planctomycetota bacterium]
MRKEPPFLLGQQRPRLRVRFWEYFTPGLVSALARAIEAGDGGGVRWFSGEGRTPAGERVGFEWRKGDPGVSFSPGRSRAPEAGGILFEGRIDYWTANLLRNFPVFHLRSKLRLPGGRWADERRV